MARKGLSELLTQFWQAQARISSGISAQALRTWTTINPTDPVSTGASWVALMLVAIRSSRPESVKTAQSFYRLYRALETDTTLALPDQIADMLTLGQLREEWARDANLPDIPRFDDDDFPVQVEPFDWPALDEESLDRAAAVSLAGTGPARVNDLSQRGRLDDPEFLSSLESASRNAANVAAREASRPGRSFVDQASKKDGAVLGWARVTDGNPCHFCALLASRGAVYKSRQRASIVNADLLPDTPEDIKKYHAGCHCQVVPVYTRNDFLTPEARSLQTQWREVTRGKSGANARAAWRTHIDAQQRATTQATNARLLQSAQEANGNV